MSTWVATTGARLGDRYVLEAKIGEGGMGEVWRGKHLALENEVAIKFLSGSLAANDETKKRFLMEAKLTAQLRSRHAVQVFDFGLTEDDQPYLVMELLHGEPLSTRIERDRRVAPGAVAHLMNAAAKALQRAHALGIVHRDFKPDNIFLTKGEEQEVEVKVVDFGIAKLIGSLDEARPSASDFAEITGKGLSQLTRTGKLVGTPHYMSPEQVRMSPEVGSAADIWAFGVVAFEALTGECPFGGDSVIELFANIQLGKSRNARTLNPDIPEAFEQWFHTACAIEPSLRFADAQLASAALADALGVSIVALPAADLSNPRLLIASSSGPDVSAVSSTDVLARSKVTLLSSAADHESAPKKSRSLVWWVAISVVLGISGMGLARFAGQRQHAATLEAAAPAQNTPTSSVGPAVMASGVASGTAASGTAAANGTVQSVASSAAGVTGLTVPSNGSTYPVGGAADNTEKLHASGARSRGAHAATSGREPPSPPPSASPSSSPSSLPASHATAPPSAAPTASGAASPFSLPPLGI